MDPRNQLMQKPYHHGTAAATKAHELSSNHLLNSESLQQSVEAMARPSKVDAAHKTFGERAARDREPTLLSASCNFLAEDSLISNRRNEQKMEVKKPAELKQAARDAVAAPSACSTRSGTTTSRRTSPRTSGGS